MAPGSLNSAPQPTLHAGAIILRPWVLDDTPMLIAAYQDPAIQRWHVRSMDEAEATAWVASRNELWHNEKGASFAIEVDGVAVGRMELREERFGDGITEIAYWLLSSHRGQGIAPSALEVVTDWAFGIGTHRIYLSHSVHNPESCRVATKCRYDYEGTQRSAAAHVDGWHDMHLHAAVSGIWTK